MIDRQIIKNKIKNREILFDGAMGTELIKKGLKKDDIPEIWNISKPEIVKNIHKDYIKNGASIITTNTFGANSIRLNSLKSTIDYKIVNAKAVEIAKQAILTNNVLIAGDIGPTGKTFIQDSVTYNKIYSSFKKQAKILIESGVDLIIIETMSSLIEAKAAFFAVRDFYKDIFIALSLTFSENEKTLFGTDTTSFALSFSDLDIDAIGFNCSIGPEKMRDIYLQLYSLTDHLIFIQPNAGLPKFENNKTIYPLNPEKFTEELEFFVKNNIDFIGSCCGSSPSHTYLLRNLWDRESSNLKSKTNIKGISSSLSSFIFTKQKPICFIGEKINPTGKKKLPKYIEKKNIDKILNIAKKQQDNIADSIDINLGNEENLDLSFVKNLIINLDSLIRTPLTFDFQSLRLLQTIFPLYPGRAILNSINVNQDEISKKAPLLKRYGGMVILLATEDKILTSFKEKIKIIEKGIDILTNNGISPNRVIIDPLITTLSATDPTDSLEVIKWLKNEELLSVIGLSNISFGLPKRAFINTSFLIMALLKGLDAVIADPYDEYLKNILYSSELILKKRTFKSFLRKSEIETPKNNAKNISILDKISAKVIDGDNSDLYKLIDKAIKEKYNPLSDIAVSIKNALDIVGKNYENKKIFLPQLIMSAETAKLAFNYLNIFIEKKKPEKKEVILLASVYGDIHDIGKNIVSIMLQNAGYKIIDLGVNVKSEEIIKNAIKYNVSLIGLSSLITTTIPYIKEVIKLRNENSLQIPIIVGGAVLNKKLSEKLKADGYGKDAYNAVIVAKELIKRSKV